jgi:RNA polymerase sigma-70 factor (ECF subfamily)
MIDGPDRSSGSQEADTEPAPADDRTDEAHALQRALIAIYRELAVGLERTWGSRDAALDALQDASAKLAAGARIGAVHNPRAYLRRMAFNLGQNKRRALSRSVPVDRSILDTVADDAPDPERMAASANELARALVFAQHLPEQRRTIFFLRWIDDLSTGEIADRLGLRRRTVQKELARAADFLRRRLENSGEAQGDDAC